MSGVHGVVGVPLAVSDPVTSPSVRDSVRQERARCGKKSPNTKFENTKQNGMLLELNRRRARRAARAGRRVRGPCASPSPRPPMPGAGPPRGAALSPRVSRMSRQVDTRRMGESERHVHGFMLYQTLMRRDESLSHTVDDFTINLKSSTSRNSTKVQGHTRRKLHAHGGLRALQFSVGR